MRQRHKSRRLRAALAALFIGAICELVWRRCPKFMTMPARPSAAADVSEYWTGGGCEL